MSSIRLISILRAATGVVTFIAGTLSCTDLDIVPNDARISCSGAEDCPAGLVCRGSIEECISEEVLNLPPIAFSLDPTLDRTVLSRQSGFSTAAFSADLTSDPVRILEVFVGTTPIDCGDERELRCMIDVVALDLDDGVHSVDVAALDIAGNDLRGSVDFLVDNTPPDLVAIPFRLIPNAGNPRNDISALGVGTGRAEVDVVFTEPLSEIPQLELLGTPPIALVPIDPPDDPTTEVAFRFSLTVDDASAEQGTRSIALVATDAVGNLAELTTSASVDIDTIAPAPPTTDVADSIVFRRVPWGSSATTEFSPSFSIVGQENSVEGNALIRSRVGPAISDLLTGEGVADATGAMDFPLLPFDVPRVYLSAIDGAGNESERAVIHDIEWTASLGGKISGSVVENPHRFLRATAFSPLTINQERVLEVGSTAALTTTPSAAAQLGVISDNVFTSVPQGPAGNLRLLGAAVAFHAGRGTVMVFGGERNNFGNVTNDLYEIVNDQWLEVITENKPFRANGQMVYEPAFDRLLLLVSNALFVFENGDWRQLPVAAPVMTTTNPEGIENGKFVYDPVHVRTMLSNGVKTSFFDGREWSPILESPQVPARAAFAMGFDPREQKIMLYGGIIAQNYVGDRWYFDADIAGGTWVQTDDSEPNSDMNLVGDTNRNLLFSVGGNECIEDPDTFDCTRPVAIVQQFDPDTNVLSPVGDFGIDAIGGEAIFDPVADRILWIGGLPRISIFGGPEANYLAMDSDFNVDNFSLVAAPPRAANNQTGVFDVATSEPLFLFGESASKAIEIFTDAVVFGPDAPRLLPSTGVDPFFDVRPFFDGETIAFRAGGGQDQFIRRVGDGWTSQPSGGFPEGAAAAYDVGRDTVFGFGGIDAANANATFSYAAGVATPIVTTTTPPPRRDTHLVYDNRRQAVLMFGGRSDGGELFDTWMFDGTDWTQLSDDAPISVFDGLTFVFDTERGRPMLLRNQAVFELTESGWHQATFAVEDQRSNQAYVYDPIAQTILSYGGRLGGTINTVRSHDHEPSRRPVHVFDVDLRTRRALTTAAVQAVTVRAVAGGRGSTRVERPAGQTPQVNSVDGASLHIWTDRYREVVSNEGAPDTALPLSVTISVDDVAGAQTITGVGDQRLRVAVTPTQGQGPRGPNAEGAELVTQAIEVVIRYRE